MTNVTVIRNTAGPVLPALIAGAGDRAALRFLEFFTVNIRNKNTRAAYARAAGEFLIWCEGQGIGELGRVQPVHVAAYIEQFQGKRAAPTVKQHLACIRMLFDWLVTGQVMPSNPAHSVRGPRHSVSKGSTPVLSSEDGKTKKLGPGAMSRTDVWYMVRRRASGAGIETAIGCHTFRATGITDYLTNGGRIEVAQRMAGHSNAKTTGLYDRRNDDISVGEVERIGI